MWRRKQNSYCGDYRKKRENYKAQPIDDHRGELPIPGYLALLVILPKLQAERLILVQGRNQYKLVALRYAPGQ